MTLKVLGTIDFTDRKLACKIHCMMAIIALPIIPAFAAYFVIKGYSTVNLCFLIPIIAAGFYLHEVIHSVFQWIFSGKKPHIGYKFPNLYSAMSPDCSMTRKQAIICALAPFFVVGILLIIPMPFITNLPRMVLLASVCFQVPISAGDFYFASRLRKYPPDVRVKNDNLRNVIFMPNT